MRSNNPRTFTVEDAELKWLNFSGAESQYNREGDRNFSLVLPEPLAQQLLEDGWNVKQVADDEEGNPGFYHISVAVRYDVRPPKIVMITSTGRHILEENEVGALDWANIRTVDLIVREYAWEYGGKTGIKAYLQSMYITIEEDELERKYAQMEDPNIG